MKYLQLKLANFSLPNLGSLWMLVAALGFAIMGALVKVGAQKFSSGELVFYRSLFGLITIWLYIHARKLPLATPVMFKHRENAAAKAAQQAKAAQAPRTLTLPLHSGE